jgi:hypothetical protein
VIDDGDIDNLGLANAGGVLGYRVKHGLNITWRIGDYAENVADRRLLLQRLVPFADDLCKLRFVSASDGTAACGLRRVRALSRYRLTASRFNRFAAFLGMPSHCLPPRRLTSQFSRLHTGNAVGPL